METEASHKSRNVFLRHFDIFFAIGHASRRAASSMGISLLFFDSLKNVLQVQYAMTVVASNM
jgi:hypothetical protein